MAIEKKRMQQRYGTYQQFQDNINSLLPNEFASVVSDDPNTDSGEGLYFQCGSNTPKRILTEEDKSLPVVTVIDSNSDNDHIPTEKAVYDALENKLSSAAGAVKTANIDTGAVTEVKLAANSVTTAKIKDGNVTEAKLAAAFKDTLYKVNTTDQQPNYAICDAKTIYVGAKLGNERGIIIPFFGKDKQMFIGVNGTICVRHYTGGNDYQDWEPNLSELTANKKAWITSANLMSREYYPSISAVVDYLTSNYTDSTALNTLLNTRLNSKADTTYVDNRLNSKADSSALTAKEDLSNKIITGENLFINKNSTEKYPAAKAIVDYLMLYYANKKDQGYLQGEIADICAYLGYTSPDILGLQADFVNSRFTRLAGAEELEAGSDFDDFPMFGGRRRCCVANDGTINAYYGEQGYAEDGTNGQVMVYQPKFYYRMVPLKLEKQASGLGYHIRKANYYITATPHPGFKLHPLFYDANGNEVDYVLLSAYEGSMYDVSKSAYINDGIDNISYESGDLLCSVSGKKPISGKLTTIGTRMNFEAMAQTRGTSWHLDTIQSVSANQLLMLIELGTFDVQSAIGNGVVTASDNDNYNCASLTGATASLGNATGMASTTIGESAGTETTETTNGKLSVSYRGVENPWGNIWKYINGLNLWGNGSMNGGQAYICSNFTFSDSDRTQHYQPSGFTVSNDVGYVSAFGYGDEAYDWLMIPSECTGRSIEPVCDQSYVMPNLNDFNIARFGGSWNSNMNGGAYCWGFVYTPGFRYYFLGGRLLYVPTASV